MVHAVAQQAFRIKTCCGIQRNYRTVLFWKFHDTSPIPHLIGNNFGEPEELDMCICNFCTLSMWKRWSGTSDSDLEQVRIETLVFAFFAQNSNPLPGLEVGRAKLTHRKTPCIRNQATQMHRLAVPKQHSQYPQRQKRLPKKTRCPAINGRTSTVNRFTVPIHPTRARLQAIDMETSQRFSGGRET